VCEDDVVRVACRPCDIRPTPVVYCGEFAAAFNLLYVSCVHSAKWVQRMFFLCSLCSVSSLRMKLYVVQLLKVRREMKWENHRI